MFQEKPGAQVKIPSESKAKHVKPGHSFPSVYKNIMKNRFCQSDEKANTTGRQKDGRRMPEKPE